MEYLLIMSLSGSTMTAMCIVFGRIMRDRCPAGLQYLLLKAAVLYYLVPLPFLKGWYDRIAGFVLTKRHMEAAQVSLKWGNYAIQVNGRVYPNAYLKIQMIVGAVWLLVSLGLFLFELWDYFRTGKRIRNFMDAAGAKKGCELSEELREQYGIRRKVYVYQIGTAEKTMTFGVFKPVILCGRELGSMETDLLLRHELMHIRRWDTLWKTLRQLAFFLHWWNPFMWILYNRMERFGECACDEAVIQGMTKTEIKRYLRLLISESALKKPGCRSRLQCGMEFSSEAKRLQERMENVMKNKMCNTTVAGFVMAVLVLANSMTVFAYGDVTREGMEGEAPRQEIDEMFDGETLHFIPNDDSMEWVSDIDVFQIIPTGVDFRYEEQFIDVDGSVYPMLNTQDDMSSMPYWGCDHDYVAGTRVLHKTNDDGSCKVTMHSAQKCRKCDFVLIGDKISETVFTKCPH